MALDVVTVAPNRSSAARRVLGWGWWVGIAGLVGFFYWAVVSRYIHFDAAHYRVHWDARWWLVAHLGGGSLALLLGPLQFSGYVRRRFVAVHRWSGRAYLVGVLVGGLASIYLGVVAEIRAFGEALLFLAVAWLLTSGMGYLAVMRRQFGAHREWMVRSYVVTFGFVLFRLQGKLGMFHGLKLDASLVMRTWVAWAAPLVLAEVWLQWRRTVGPGR